MASNDTTPFFSLRRSPHPDFPFFASRFRPLPQLVHAWGLACTHAFDDFLVSANEKGGRVVVDLPANSWAFWRREVGTEEAEIPEALLTALGVVSMLVRHEASDSATRR